MFYDIKHLKHLLYFLKHLRYVLWYKTLEELMIYFPHYLKIYFFHIDFRQQSWFLTNFNHIFDLVHMNYYVFECSWVAFVFKLLNCVQPFMNWHEWSHELKSVKSWIALTVNLNICDCIWELLQICVFFLFQICVWLQRSWRIDLAGHHVHFSNAFQDRFEISYYM